MKRSLLSTFIIMTLIGSVAIAQPTITSLSFFQVGDPYDVTILDTSANEGAAMPGAWWDFSSIPTGASASGSIIDPATSAHASSFPNATAAVSISGLEQFYRVTSSSFEHHGDAQGSTVISFSNPQQLISLPVEYNDMNSDTWSGTFTTSATFNRSGVTTSNADGFGTLVTPLDTFQNVLRVHVYQDYTDATSGFPDINYDVHLYQWYSEDHTTPLMQITYFQQEQSGFTSSNKQVFLFPSSAVPTNIEDDIENKLNVSIYPNPASNYLEVEIADNTSPPSIELSDISGKVCASINNTTEDKVSLDVSTLASGMYLLTVTTEGNRYTEKIIIE